jgi:hypothetical protein
MFDMRRRAFITLLGGAVSFSPAWGAKNPFAGRGGPYIRKGQVRGYSHSLIVCATLEFRQLSPS